MKWETMRGDERERFCEKCQRSVVNFSRLTEAQRQALLEKARTERVCVTYEERLASPARRLPKPERLPVTLLGMVGFAAVAAMLLAFAPEPSVQRNSNTSTFHPQIALRRYYDSTRHKVDEWMENMRVYFGGKPRPDPLLRRMGEIDCGRLRRITPPGPSAPSPSSPATPPLAEPRALPPK